MLEYRVTKKLVAQHLDKSLFYEKSHVMCGVGWSQGKLWWRLVAVLTCKSIVKSGY